jgi:hypothetical protein
MTYVDKTTIRHGMQGTTVAHPAEDSAVFFAIYYGKALPSHGTSRSHQTRLITTSGAEIFSNEEPAIDIGTRVRFTMATEPTLGVEQIAVGIEPAEPVAVIKDAKIAKK